MRLKVSVLTSGTILVDAKPATFEELEAALARVKEAKGQVWYYRESAGGQPAAAAMQVIQRIVALKVPISLSSKPDFSDWVDAKGVSHPRNAPQGGFAMPEVAKRSDIEEIFARVRATAAGRGPGDGLVIVKPDRTHLVMPRLAETAALKSMAENVSKLLPAMPQRNIAAISFTEFATTPGSAPDLAEVNKSIPFLGMLVGFAYIGHAVWVFEGHPSSLTAGCRDADVLIVDSAMRPLLEAGWDARVAAVMRNANILVHNRANFSLSAIRKVGNDPSRFEFTD